MEGVKNCFKYQRDVVGDGAGASVNPYVPKLRPLYDIVKEGTNKKIRKKLLENIIKSLDFDPVKLNVDVSPTHIEYVRFVVENLAFFDYVNTEDVYLVVTQMEKLVAETGLVVTHSIETEIFRIGQEEGGKAEPRRLKVLSTGAAILSMVSIARSYIRRAFGVNDGKIRDYRNKKFKANDPTLNKAPGRNSNVSMATPFQQIEDLAKSYEDGEEMMMEQCRKFVEILNCDEFKVAGEGTDDEEADFGRTGNTPESAEDGSVAPPTPKKKRKGSADPEKPTKRRKAVPKKRK